MVNSILEKALSNSIVDINKRPINVGDTIKWNYFYWDEGSSEDWFDTEPQVSFNVVEAYVEEVKSKVIVYMGALCVEYDGKILSLKEIAEKMPTYVDEFAMMHEGYELNNFLNEGVFNDRPATLDEVKEIFSQFEIINEEK